MRMFPEIFDLFITLFGLVPELIIFIAATRYVRANPGTEGMLMITGSAITLIGGIGFGLGRFAYTFFFFEGGGALETFYQILSYAFIAGGLLFTLGLLLVVLKETPQGREGSVPPSA